MMQTMVKYRQGKSCNSMRAMAFQYPFQGLVSVAVCLGVGEAPRPPALMQCCYRRQSNQGLHGKEPYTCVLLQLSASGLTPSARRVLQSSTLQKVVNVHRHLGRGTKSMVFGEHTCFIRSQDEWNIAVNNVSNMSVVIFKELHRLYTLHGR
jgi:hypothetical protein